MTAAQRADYIALGGITVSGVELKPYRGDEHPNEAAPSEQERRRELLAGDDPGGD